MFNPQKDVRVISNSMTYYPIDSRNEEGLTLINSIAFLQENFRESVQSFQAEDQIVVMQMWNGLLFAITSKNTVSEPLLKIILQVMKDIAVFLFGPQFHTVMCSKSISGALREIYARYLETYFSLCNQDCKFTIMLPQMDHTFVKLTQQFKELIKNEAGIVDESFLEGILFNNHRVISRFAKNENSMLELNDIFQLSLLEQVEFSTAKNSPEAFTMTIKGANVRVDGTMQNCILASGKLGPFFLIMLYKRNQQQQFTQEQKDKLEALSAAISRTILAFTEVKKPPVPYQITGLLHYILINRTTGEIYESQPHPDSKHEPEPKWLALLDKLKRTMTSIGMSAIVNGNSCVIRNEMIFQYTYDLVFVRKQKEIMPKTLLQPVNFEKGGLSYKSIVSETISEDNTTCFEMMTVYLGVMNTCDVIKANAYLFNVLTGVKRKSE